MPSTCNRMITDSPAPPTWLGSALRGAEAGGTLRRPPIRGFQVRPLRSAASRPLHRVMAGAGFSIEPGDWSAAHLSMIIVAARRDDHPEAAVETDDDPRAAAADFSAAARRGAVQQPPRGIGRKASVMAMRP